MLGLIST